ncbi:UvrD-helicase domain-containing protein [candidate division KSB1 bacterium]|nr:UvrD-helicase domain-containing protein [candidate division KSB1 bacterium]
MEDIFKSLNPEQLKAVTAPDGPILVLAGAGSGKTRVLTTRIAHLIKQREVPPWQILSMTFTNKAAGEMRGRVAKLTGENKGLWVGTFHSIFAKLLRMEAQQVGLYVNFGIYDSDDQVRLIKSIMETLRVPVTQYAPKSIASVISKCKNGLIPPNQFMKSASTPFEEIAGKIYSAYENQLRLNQVFDFDDLITVPIQIFEKYPEILAKYQERFQYVHVDEYQDTNIAQYTLVRMLAEVHQNLYVVGDDDQSIYGWRGADIRNILDFEKDFPNTQIFRLEQNYRSTKTILKAASSVVVHNSGRKGKTLWTDGADGEKIELIETMDEREEASRIVEKTRDEVFKHKRTFKDFAILYRTSAQSRAIEDALRRGGMSYVIVGGVRFYERKEIKDALAYLKLIANPMDTVSLKRIINFPARGIGDVSLTHVQNYAAEQGKSIFDSLADVKQIPELTERAGTAIHTFNKMIVKYQQLIDEISPNELVHTLMDECGLLHNLKEDSTSEGQSRLENIREFLSAIKEYVEESDSPTLAGFLEGVALVSDVDTWNDKTNAITLMTLHSAKGLEFPVIFIPGMEENLFPISRALESPEQIEEERRLFYVGLTRAEQKVYLLYTNRRNTYGSESYRLPSRFIDEIDSSVIERKKSRSTTTSSSLPSSFTRPRISSQKIYADAHPDYEAFSQESTLLRKGLMVTHALFGRGQITSVEGSGKKMKVTVQFQNGSVKKFIAQYAQFDIG